jgi:hypothetical protein
MKLTRTYHYFLRKIFPIHNTCKEYLYIQLLCCFIERRVYNDYIYVCVSHLILSSFNQNKIE